MTETMTEPKQVYFDELVKGNILSFIPTKENFNLGTFYNKIFFFDGETFRISEEYYSITIMKITKCYLLPCRPTARHRPFHITEEEEER